MKQSQERNQNLKKSQKISILMIAWKIKVQNPQKMFLFMFFDYILHVIVEFIAAVICLSGIRRTQQPPLLNPLAMMTIT